MADYSELRIEAAQAIAEASDTLCTFSRPSTSATGKAGANPPFETPATFDWNKSVFRAGQWIKAVVVTIGALAGEPKEGDRMMAGGRAFKVVGVKPQGPGIQAVYYEVEVSG